MEPWLTKSERMTSYNYRSYHKSVALVSTLLLLEPTAKRKKHLPASVPCVIAEKRNLSLMAKRLEVWLYSQSQISPSRFSYPLIWYLSSIVLWKLLVHFLWLSIFTPFGGNHGIYCSRLLLQRILLHTLVFKHAYQITKAQLCLSVNNMEQNPTLLGCCQATSICACLAADFLSFQNFACESGRQAKTSVDSKSPVQNPPHCIWVADGYFRQGRQDVSLFQHLICRDRVWLPLYWPFLKERVWKWRSLSLCIL